MGNKPGNVSHNLYNSYAELQSDLRTAGLESAELVIGVDLSASNTEAGEGLYPIANIHDYKRWPNGMTPYLTSLQMSFELLKQLDNDGIAECFRFGDQETADKCVKPLNPNGDPRCNTFEDIKKAYDEAIDKYTLYGPTTAAALYRKAIEISKANPSSLIICLLLTDGGISEVEADKKALAEASKYPISVIAIGLGKGPWNALNIFDNCKIANRSWDNFNAVIFSELEKKRTEVPEEVLTMMLLREVPSHFRKIKELGLLNKTY